MITGYIIFTRTDWSTLIPSDEDEQTFLDALAELNFEQLIKGKEKVQLDLILCNHPGLLTLVKKTIDSHPCIKRIILLTTQNST